MFNFKKEKTTKALLEERIEQEIKALLDVIDDPDAYKAKKEKIDELKQVYNTLYTKKTAVERTPIFVSMLGLVGTLMIMHYEKTDVITTKAFGLVNRMLGGK